MRQAEEGTRVGEVCRKAGISPQTYYRWRKKYGGLMPSEMRRLKQLEEENRRLKRLVADLSLDKEMLQGVVRKKALRPARRCELVDDLRRTCAVLRAGRSSYHYRSRRPAQPVLKRRIREIGETRVATTGTAASMFCCSVRAGR